MRREILNREEFFDLFQKPSQSGQVISHNQLALRGGGSSPALEVIWADDGHQDALPAVCIVRKENLRDFLAWTATYLPSASPITALCRVMTPEGYESLPRNRAPWSPRARILNASALGAILAEALSYLDGKEDLNRLSSAACARTFSYAAARAIFMGYDWSRTSAAGTAWLELREFTTQPSTVLAPQGLQACWSVIYSLRSGDQGREADLSEDLKVILQACEEIDDSSEISRSTWQILTGHIHGLLGLPELMTGPREERVLVIERVLKALPVANLLGDDKLSFAVSYLVSRISPGTLDHFSLLRTSVPENSPALVWYGMCSGLGRRTDLRDASGLSLRVLRDLVRAAPIDDKPDCDLSIDELKVLMSAASKESGIKPAMPGYLVVELIPYVNSTVRWPGTRSNVVTDAPNSMLLRDAARLLEDLAKLGKRADYMSYSLNRYLPRQEQADDTDRKTRRKRN
jgi:hypothetical protein